MSQPSDLKAEHAWTKYGLRRWQFSLRELLFGMTVVSLYVVAYTTVTRGIAQHAPARSWIAAFIPVITTLALFGFLWLLARKHTRCARFVFQPKRGKFQASGFVLAPVAVLLVYLIFDPLMSKWPPWWALLIGFQVGMAIGVVFCAISVLTPALTLCETGIVIHSMHYVPWKRIHTAEWELRDTGELRIACWGRQRVVVGVPPEQRDAVEALLKDKLADTSRS